MSGIIKTIKAKDEHDVQHNIFPKTVLEAVVDSETNETLDVILDELNDKVDNIEITGGGDASNKVDKSGDTMTGMLTVKDNISVEGDLFVPITPEQSLLNSEQPYTNFTAPTSGGWQENVSYLMQDMANAKTFFGSYHGAVDSAGHENYWHNVMSVRHINGRGDGNGHGMYIRSHLTQAGSLCWSKQYGGNWESEKIILDTDNYARYALPLSGGTVSGTTTFNGVTYLNSKDTIMQNGSLCVNLTSDGTDGYWKWATITMTSSATYCGALISARISNRGDAEGRVEIYIGNGATAGQGFGVGAFRQHGNAPQCYIYQSATGVFDLYLRRTPWMNCTISDLSFPRYMQDRCNITWYNQQTSLPSGATAATVTNDWSNTVTSTTGSISFTMKPYSGYIIYVYTTGNTNMSSAGIIYPHYDSSNPSVGGWLYHNITAAGSAFHTISGTTFTYNFGSSGAIVSAPTVLKYIEIR